MSNEIQVTVQNRGTSVLTNTLLEIKTPYESRRFNATTLVPGAVQTFSFPVRLSGLTARLPLYVTSSLSLSGPGEDTSPQNNQRSDNLYVP